jgi:hypothetical protein
VGSVGRRAVEVDWSCLGRRFSVFAAQMMASGSVNGRISLGSVLFLVGMNRPVAQIFRRGGGVKGITVARGSQVVKAVGSVGFQSSEFIQVDPVKLVRWLNFSRFSQSSQVCWVREFRVGGLVREKKSVRVESLHWS